jgi:tetratricopeptide (TPR) repeat protein
VIYDGLQYELRATRSDKKTYLLVGAFALIVFLALIIRGLGSGDTVPATLFGVLTNASDSTVVRDATVSIPKLGLSAETGSDGVFAIEGIEVGKYQLRVQADSFATAYFPIEIESSKGTLLLGSLIPLITASDSTDEETEEDTQPTKPKRPRYGTLRVKTNVDSAEIVVNGKFLGTGNSTFKRMKLGKHLLSMQCSGYLPFEKRIEIKRGEITDVVAILEEDKPAEREYSAAEYMEQAEELFKQGNYVEAIGYFTLAIAKDKTLARAYRRQAEANIKLGRKLNAQADLLAAARLYTEGGKFKDAIACYDRILAFIPGAATVYQRRGWAKIFSGNFDAGLADLEHGLDLDSDNWLARFQYGKALYFTSNYKESEKQLKKIRRRAEEMPLIVAYLALAYLGRGDESDARKYYEKFMEHASPSDIRMMENEAAWQQLTTLAASD